MDLTTLTKMELNQLETDIKAEKARRRTLCPDCGGVMKIWMAHVCSEEGGINLPMHHPMIKAMARAADPA